MSNSPTRDKGAGITFIRANVAYEGDDCLIWPLHRDPRGYGMMGWLGKMRYAHRVMCIMAKGEPPTPKHQAAHSCGNGDKGCVNPRHLSWKTNSENQLDRSRHGTRAKAGWGWKGKLTAEQVAEIRSLKGRMTQYEIAALFNVSQQNVGDIHRGRTWKAGLSGAEARPS
jgi:hypothetical protein